MSLTQNSYQSIREVLLGEQAESLIDLMFRRKLGMASEAQSAKCIGLAIDLGLLKADGSAFTHDGELVGDSLREYKFWLGRNRCLPLEGQVSYLSEGYYEGKMVVEIGSGYGCNLLNIRRTANAVLGVEPCSVYHQMSEILCAREGAAALDLRLGSGEHTGLADSCADVVLSISTHQYTDVVQMLKEAKRILKPGGELQIVGGTMGPFALTGLEAVRTRSPRALLSYSRTMANTLSFVATRRRLFGSNSPTTAYPVYPSRDSMHGWLKAIGLEQVRADISQWPETVFFYRKP